jgi:hypothetical protein
MYHEGVLESFDFTDDIEVPPGEYTFYGLKGYVNTPMGKAFSAILNFDAGSFYDGWRATVGVKPVWGISPEFSLTGMYEFNRVVFPDRNQELTAHIVRARFLATLTTKFSISTFVQYNSAIHAVIANLRIRYNPREGVDLYVVYNEDFNTNRFREIPNLPHYNSRTIMVKFSYTFVFE